MQCKLISDRRLEWKLGLRIVKQDKYLVLKSWVVSFFADRHLYVVQNITSLNENLCTNLAICNTTQNNRINSHKQDTTAIQPTAFLTVIQVFLLVINIQLSDFLCETTTKLKVVLLNSQHSMTEQPRPALFIFSLARVTCREYLWSCHGNKLEKIANFGY